MTMTLFLTLIISALVPQVLAGCWVRANPRPFNDICTQLPVDVGLETNLILFEDKAGDCSRQYAAIGSNLYQNAAVIYTGRDNQVVTAQAINSVHNGPAITGTYTFDFDIPQSSMKAGSPVTQIYTYSAPDYPDFYKFSWTFFMNGEPTTTVTTALETVTTNILSPTTHISTETITSGTYTLASYRSTRTIRLPRVTVTTTRPVSTIRRKSTVFITKSLTAACLRNTSPVTVIGRRAQTYSNLQCGQTLITPTATETVTIPTSTVTITSSSLIFATATAIIPSATTRHGTRRATTITITRPTITRTSRPRTTVTKVVTSTVKFITTPASITRTCHPTTITFIPNPTLLSSTVQVSSQ